jgi:hypothetical protein
MKTWAAWLLVISVQLQLDPPALVLYLDPEDPPADAALVEKVACPSLRTDQVPLPVPYTVRRLRKAGEGQRYVPTPQAITGLLTRCE